MRDGSGGRSSVRKFNENHDPDNGQFASGDGGSGGGGSGGSSSNNSAGSSSSGKKRDDPAPMPAGMDDDPHRPTIGEVSDAKQKLESDHNITDPSNQSDKVATAILAEADNGGDADQSLYEAVAVDYGFSGGLASLRGKKKSHTHSAATGHSTQSSRRYGRPLSKTGQGGPLTMTLAEQIASLEAKRAANVARMEAITTKAAEDGRTTEVHEQEEFDTLADEVEQIDKDLVRNKKMLALKASSAKPANGSTSERARDSRDVSAPSLNLGPKREEVAKGIRFARYAKAMGCSYLSMRSGDFRPAIDFARAMNPRDTELHEMFEKAAVTAGGTNATHNWGSQLVGTETSAFADFAEFLRPQTILGKFGVGNIPALRQVPFRTRLLSQTGGGEGYWVGESQGKPLTSFAFGSTTLTPLKVANIAVCTMELLRDSSPSAEAIVRDQLAAALKQRMDIDFISPTKGASAGVSPASITNSISQTASTGNQAPAIRQDIAALMESFITANNPPTSGVWIMKSTTAMRLSLMRNDLGSAKEFPDINLNGGTLEGLPVITSEHVPEDTYGTFVVLVNAGDIYFADEGEIAVDMSQEASLNMVDTAGAGQASDSPPVPSTVVSLWQTNSVGFRAERTVNWSPRRDAGVAVLDGVHWGEPGSP